MTEDDKLAGLAWCWCPYHQNNCKVEGWNADRWPKLARFTHCIEKDDILDAWFYWHYEPQTVRLWLRSPRPS